MDCHKIDWQVKRLEELCQFQNGYSFKNKDYQNQLNDGYVVFRMGNINRGGELNRSASSVYVSRDLSTKLSRFVLDKNDIVMCMTDMKSSMNLLGHTALIDKNDYYILNQRVGRITVTKEDILDYRYLFYYTNSKTYLEHLRSMAHSGVQVNLSTKAIQESPILLPPFSTQRKIAAVLSAYDDLIENNTRRIKILEGLAAAIYREWFVEFRFPGHEGAEIRESELGLIPQGWKIEQLGDIIENIKEKVKPGEHLEPLPYVPIDCMPRRSIALTEHKPSSEARSSLIAFKRNDILFGAMRSYFHKVIFAPFDGITRQTCFVLRSKNPNNYPFDLFTIFQDSTVEYSSNYSTGSTIPYATWDGALVRMPIVKPPNPLIERFGSIVRPMLNSIRQLMMQNANLRETRDLLLPKLITGEIDVSGLDIDID